MFVCFGNLAFEFSHHWTRIRWNQAQSPVVIHYFHKAKGVKAHKKSCYMMGMACLKLHYLVITYKSVLEESATLEAKISFMSRSMVCGKNLLVFVLKHTSFRTVCRCGVYMCVD